MGLFGVRSDIAAVLDGLLAASQTVRGRVDELTSDQAAVRAAAAQAIRGDLANTVPDTSHLLQYRDFDRVVHATAPDMAAITWAAGVAAADVTGTLGRAWVDQALLPHLDHLDDTLGKAKRISAFWMPTFDKPINSDALRGAGELGPLRETAMHKPSWYTANGLRAHYDHAWFEGCRTGVEHTRLNASDEILGRFADAAARLGRGEATAADQTLMRDHRDVMLDLASHRARSDVNPRLAALTLMPHDAASPRAVRGGLVRAQLVLASLGGAVPPAAEPIRVRTVELLARNLERIDRSSSNEGWSNYPDYAELGAIRSNLSLLGAFMDESDRVAASSGDLITW